LPLCGVGFKIVIVEKLWIALELIKLLLLILLVIEEVAV
jgi:hypothetical protein